MTLCTCDDLCRGPAGHTADVWGRLVTMSPMPLPVRVAAGLMVTALEQARKLPDQLAELPVTAASRAVQAGMRVQQRVTELAIKGDEVFSLFRRVEDTPSWARF